MLDLCEKERRDTAAPPSPQCLGTRTVLTGPHAWQENDRHSRSFRCGCGSSRSSTASAPQMLHWQSADCSSDSELSVGIGIDFPMGEDIGKVSLRHPTAASCGLVS